MENRNGKVKRYSKIYKSVPKKRSAAYYIFSYTFIFIVVAAVAYLGSMALNSFLNRPHCTEIGPLDEQTQNDDNVLAQANEANSSGKSENVTTDVEIKPINCADLQLSGTEVDLVTLASDDKTEKFLTKLKNEDNNAVVVCLKGTDGKLLYNSEFSLAKQWKAVTSSKVDFEDVVGKIKEQGLVPIAKINAFFDQTAPEVERENSFVLNEKVNVFSAEKGLKKGKWLNCATSSARNYVVGVATEIAKLGFEYILIDSGFFPVFKTKQETENFVDYDENVRLQSILAFVCELQKKGIKPIFSYPVRALYDEDLAKSLFGSTSFLDKISLHSPIIDGEADLKKCEDKLIDLAVNRFVMPQLVGGGNKAAVRKKLKSYAIKSAVTLRQ